MRARKASGATEIVYALARGGRDYREEATASCIERRRSLLDTVRRVAEQRPTTNILGFPAGYLGVRGVAERDDVIDEINQELAQISPPFGVLWGIDIDSRQKRSKKNQTIRSDDGYPFFVSYRGPDGITVRLQQISINTKEGRSPDVDQQWSAQRRDALLPGTRIAVLICGEALSERLRARVSSAGGRALLIPAHFNVNLRRDYRGMGKMSWHHPLATFQREHVPVLLSEHTGSPDRHRYSWPMNLSRACQIEDLPGGLTLRMASV
jgi:hypothetical protein